MSGMVGLWGASSLVRSVQRGVITLAINTTSGTATIAAVDTANSVLVFLMNSTNYNNTEWRYQMGRMALTNSTTITLSRTATALVGDSIAGSWELIEFHPGVIKSIQRGTVTVDGSATDTATITAVNPAKSQTYALGMTGDSNLYAGYTQQVYLTLTDATTVTTTFQGWSGGGVGETVGFQVVEFY